MQGYFGSDPHICENPALGAFASLGTLSGFSGNFSGLSLSGSTIVLFGDLRTSDQGYSSVRIRSPKEEPARPPLPERVRHFPFCPLEGQFPPSLFSALWQHKPSISETTGGLSPGQLSGVVWKSESNQVGLSICEIEGPLSSALLLPRSAPKVQCNWQLTQGESTHIPDSVGTLSWSWLALSHLSSFVLPPFFSVPMDPVTILICRQTCFYASEWSVLPFLFTVQLKLCPVLSVASGCPDSKCHTIFLYPLLCGTPHLGKIFQDSQLLCLLFVTTSLVGHSKRVSCPIFFMTPFCGRMTPHSVTSYRSGPFFRSMGLHE